MTAGRSAIYRRNKEIGDYDGYYAEATGDGENPITIEVTSPDETVTKTYTVNVYRNEEDKLKNLTPLEAEDIDFENSGDVILVMIDEYPRVSSSVFEELKNYRKRPSSSRAMTTRWSSRPRIWSG